MHRNNGQGLLRAKINLFLKKSKSEAGYPPCEDSFHRAPFSSTVVSSQLCKGHSNFFFKHKADSLSSPSQTSRPYTIWSPSSLVCHTPISVHCSTLTASCLRAFVLVVLAGNTLPSSPTGDHLLGKASPD